MTNNNNNTHDPIIELLKNYNGPKYKEDAHLFQDIYTQIELTEVLELTKYLKTKDFHNWFSLGDKDVKRYYAELKTNQFVELHKDDENLRYNVYISDADIVDDLTNDQMIDYFITRVSSTKFQKLTYNADCIDLLAVDSQGEALDLLGFDYKLDDLTKLYYNIITDVAYDLENENETSPTYDDIIKVLQLALNYRISENQKNERF